MSEPEPIDLSKLQNIQFGPSWAEDLARSEHAGEVVWGKIPGGGREWEERPRFGGGPRREGGGRGFDRGPRPGGPGAGPGQRPGFDRRGPRPDFRGGGPGQGDRRPPFQGREGQGAPPRGEGRPGGPERRDFAGGRRDDRGPQGRPPFRGGERRDFRGGPGHGHGHQDFRDAPPMLQGWQVRLIPDHRHVEAIARQIKASGRAFSVFDVGRLFMESRDRYLLRFSRLAEAAPAQPQQGEGKAPPQPPRTNPGPEELYQCKADHSLWLSRDEAIRHLLHSPALTKYYRTETVTTEAPKGNWNSIAVCGFSGALLGPPNHHDFQRNVARLHRERFSDMSLERYKSRIRTEKDEALLQKWQEQQSTVLQYVPVTADEPAPAPAPVPPAEGESQSPESEGETVEPKEAPAPLKSVAEMEAHFLKHHAQTAVVAVTRPTVPGNIPGKCLAQPLFGLVRREVESQQRFPMQLVQDLCRDLEGQGLRFFKRDRKTTFVCRNRPHFLPDDLVLSDRIRAMVEMVRANPGITYSRLVSTLAPHIVVPAAPGEEVPAAAAATTETAAPAENAVAAEQPALAESDTVVPAAEAPQAGEIQVEENPVAETREAPAAEVVPLTESAESPAAGETAEAAPVQPEEETAPAAEMPEDAAEPSASAEAAASVSAGAETPPAPAAPPAPTLSPEEIVILQDLHWLVQEGYVTEFQNGELFVLGRPPQPPVEKKPRPPRPPRPATAPKPAPGEPASAEKETAAETTSAEAPAESATTPEGEPVSAGAPAAEVPAIEEVSAASAFAGEPASAPEYPALAGETESAEGDKPAASGPEAS